MPYLEWGKARDLLYLECMPTHFGCYFYQMEDYMYIILNEYDMQSLAHELCHASQCSTGRLSMKGSVVKWNGIRYANNRRGCRYYASLWECEAFAFQDFISKSEFPIYPPHFTILFSFITLAVLSISHLLSGRSISPSAPVSLLPPSAMAAPFR